MRPEWRVITLGEIYDQLKSMREAEEAIVEKYHDIPRELLPECEEVREAREDNRESRVKRAEIVEQLTPILEEVIRVYIIFAELGTVTDIEAWMTKTLKEASVLGLCGIEHQAGRMVAQVTSAVFNPDNGCLFFNIDTQGQARK